MKKIFITTIAVLTLIFPVGQLSSASSSDACKDIQFVFARGSGTPQNTGKEFLTFRDSVSENLRQSNVSYDVTDLEYPAVSVDSLATIITAFVSAGRAGEFGASVSTGVTNLVKTYQKLYKVCPNTKWVFFGYSQGAKVIASALESMDSRKILYVAMFGDPNLYLPEGQGFNPPACRNQSLSSYRAYVPNCKTASGIFGARKPYISDAYSGKVGLWCNDKDLICGSSKNLFVNSGHLKYDETTGIPSAVETAMRKIQQEFPSQTTIIPKLEPSVLDTIFLINTAAPGSNHIQTLYNEATNFARETIKSGGRIALYTYGDLRINSNSPVKICALGCTFSDFTLGLNSIIFGTSYLRQSLLSAADKLISTAQWRPNAAKSIVAYTSVGYHDPDRDGTTAEQVARHSISAGSIKLHVVIPIPAQEDYYAKLANSTGGEVIPFSNIHRMTSVLLAKASTPRPQTMSSLQKRKNTPTTLAAPTAPTTSDKDGNSVELQWQNDVNSDSTLLILDGVILGLLPKDVSRITITDLDTSKPHEFIITSLDAEYNLGTDTTISIQTKVITNQAYSTPVTIGVPSAGAK